MADLFAIIKHPASCQVSYDLVQLAAETLGLKVVVYGLQNTSPSPARANLPWSNVELLDAPVEKIGIADLVKEIEARAPKAILIAHAIYLVAGAVSGLTRFFQQNPEVRTILHCEAARSTCSSQHAKLLTELVENNKNVRLCAASKHAAALVGGEVVPWSVYPHMTKAIPKDEARKKLEIPKDAKVVLVIGRADAAGILAANLLTRDDETRVVVPTDQPNGVMEVCKCELQERGALRQETITRVVTMREIASMSHADICYLGSACDLAVHANPCNEPVIASQMLAMIGVPQVLTRLPTFVEAIGDVRGGVCWVDAPLVVYSMDDLGGKVQLASNTDIFEATIQVLDDRELRSLAAQRCAGDVISAQKKDAWQKWKDVLQWGCRIAPPAEPAAPEEAQPEAPKPPAAQDPEPLLSLIDGIETLLKQLRERLSA